MKKILTKISDMLIEYRKYFLYTSLIVTGFLIWATIILGFTNYVTLKTMVIMLNLMLSYWFFETAYWKRRFIKTYEHNFKLVFSVAEAKSEVKTANMIIDKFLEKKRKKLEEKK